LAISIERTIDIDLIKSILTSLWDVIAEDGKLIEDFQVDLENNIFLAVIDDKTTVGLYILHAYNGCTLEIHANILPEYRKECAIPSGEKVLAWFDEFAPEKYQKLFAQIPEIYPNVYRFTLERGFNDEGRLKNAYRKDGKLHDIHILGLERKTLKKVT
jgi:hypothetical protein